ncbi:glutathione S-transferase [Chaetomidium leptoderma]|uniref:Glutathione S-transferase n=1 Tax=Chaetomidium leptoderma TaxID=669021 RepID=A0AAN6VEW2_9PEZI|nr:glutathione S-transferase [Chaetomidium leptoderma]
MTYNYLYFGKGGPNPPKVAILLEELGIPYEAIVVPLSDESGAIVEYLIDQYDTGHQFSFPAGSAESYHAKQYLFFQVSGQGPYYGQAAWFKAFHPEKLPSAIARYVGKINRVTGVLEGILKKKAEEGMKEGAWLVGNKYSYADIAFVSWLTVVLKIHATDEFNPEDYPHVKAWIDRILERPAVQAGYLSMELCEEKRERACA